MGIMSRRWALGLSCQLAACAASVPPRGTEAPAPVQSKPAEPAPAPPLGAAAPAARVLPSDEEVRRILSERIGPLGEYYGIVVGLLDESGRRVISQGSVGQGSPLAL